MKCLRHCKDKKILSPLPILALVSILGSCVTSPEAPPASKAGRTSFRKVDSSFPVKSSNIYVLPVHTIVAQYTSSKED